MRLVTYAWLVIVVALIVAAIRWLGLAGWMAVVVLAASVAMHVAGNAIGTGLQARTDQGLATRREPRTPPVPTPPGRRDWRSGRLARKDRLGRLLPVSAVIGGLCGGIAGAGSLAWLVGASAAGVALGGASSAVIGGIVGFLGASFVTVVRSAIREAASTASPDPPPRQS
jgi:hypothetical protein